MAWTQSQLAALETAIAQGTLKVKYSDKEVTYRSLEEMLKLRDMMKRELSGATGSSSRVFTSFSKGMQ